MRLREESYNYIKYGTKRIELRLYDEKRKVMQLGDIITFYKEPDYKKSFKAKIVALLRYNCLDDIIKDFDINILTDKSLTSEDLKKTFNSIYTKEQQEKMEY
jgi:ASC-1-like (ASCH) protein